LEKVRREKKIISTENSCGEEGGESRKRRGERGKGGVSLKTKLIEATPKKKNNHYGAGGVGEKKRIRTLVSTSCEDKVMG